MAPGCASRCGWCSITELSCVARCADFPRTRARWCSPRGCASRPSARSAPRRAGAARAPRRARPSSGAGDGSTASKSTNCWSNAGPRLAASFLAADLVDELVLYVAPTLLGAAAAPLAALRARAAATPPPRFEFTDVRPIGGDLRLVWSLRRIRRQNSHVHRNHPGDRAHRGRARSAAGTWSSRSRPRDSPPGARRSATA